MSTWRADCEDSCDAVAVAMSESRCYTDSPVLAEHQPFNRNGKALRYDYHKCRPHWCALYHQPASLIVLRQDVHWSRADLQRIIVEYNPKTTACGRRGGHFYINCAFVPSFRDKDRWKRSLKNFRIANIVISREIYVYTLLKYIQESKYFIRACAKDIIQ